MPMTVTISLPSETEARLREQAAASGKDLSALFCEAIEEKLAASGNTVAADCKSAEDFDKILDEFFAANPERLGALPADFSRADIYADHD